MNNYKSYIRLSLFSLLFLVLLWIFPTESKVFQTIGSIGFSLMAIVSFLAAGKLRKNLDKQPFVIGSGKHKIRNRRFIKTNGDLSFTFKFGEEHRYYSKDNPKEMNSQINKLLGLSSKLIHQDSFRIGWRHTGKDRFALFVYYYKDGERKSQYIANFKPNVNFEVTLSHRESGTFFVFINDKMVFSTRIDKRLEWIVFPYFGGKYPAPHRMEFDIKMKYDK